jgi:hypothetical protein
MHAIFALSKILPKIHMSTHNVFYASRRNKIIIQGNLSCTFCSFSNNSTSFCWHLHKNATWVCTALINECNSFCRAVNRTISYRNLTNYWLEKQKRNLQKNTRKAFTTPGVSPHLCNMTINMQPSTSFITCRHTWLRSHIFSRHTHTRPRRIFPGQLLQHSYLPGTAHRSHLGPGRFCGLRKNKMSYQELRYGLWPNSDT